MTPEPRVRIILPQEHLHFRPEENLSGEIVIYDLTAAQIRAIELSILWYTEGKGEEELGTHYFERVLPSQVAGFDPATPRPFSVKLPRSPLSYDGVIVNIRWCVRVRVFLVRGREVLAERTFQLGDVPPAQTVQA